MTNLEGRSITADFIDKDLIEVFGMELKKSVRTTKTENYYVGSLNSERYLLRETDVGLYKIMSSWRAK